MKIVVSRYNEGIEWTTEFREHIVLYNKGSDYIDGAFVLPNVGREGHTYFHYICENYDTLDDYTVFLQGNPFDHSPNICSQLRELLSELPLNTKREEFYYFNPVLFECNLLYGCRYHPGLPFDRVYNTLFEDEVSDKSIKFGPGAQFCVSRDRIRRRPITFYQKIVDMLGNHVGPNEGYVIERMHMLIFGDE